MTQITFIWFMFGMLPFISLENSSKFILFNVFIFDFTEFCSCLSWDWSWLTHKMISKLFLTARIVAYLFNIGIKSVLGICNTKPRYWCWIFFIGIHQASIARLQLVQNAAARFLTSASKQEPITPILASSVSRVYFKILLLDFDQCKVLTIFLSYFLCPPLLFNLYSSFVFLSFTFFLRWISAALFNFLKSDLMCDFFFPVTYVKKVNLSNI